MSFLPNDVLIARQRAATKPIEESRKTFLENPEGVLDADSCLLVSPIVLSFTVSLNAILPDGSEQNFAARVACKVRKGDILLSVWPPVT